MMLMNFHKGLVTELQTRARLLIGLDIREEAALSILMGAIPFPAGTQKYRITAIVDEILKEDARFDIMKKWEEEHPGEQAYPQSLASVIMQLIEVNDPADAAETLQEILKLCKTELYG